MPGQDQDQTTAALAGEIQDMLKAGGFDDDPAGKPEKREVPAVAEEEEEEEVVEPTDKEEEPANEEEEEEEESAPSQTIAELKAELAELKDLIRSQAKKPDRTAEPEPEPETMDFVGDSDLDEVLSSKDGINALLNKVYQMGQESTMRRIPGVIQSSVDHYTNVKEATQQFYKDNPDLLGVRKYVARVSAEMLEDDPTLMYNTGKLFKGLEENVRKQLGLKPRGEAPSDSKKNTPKEPGFARPKGRRSARPTPTKPETEATPTQSEIEEMNKALGGRR